LVQITYKIFPNGKDFLMGTSRLSIKNSSPLPTDPDHEKLKPELELRDLTLTPLFQLSDDVESQATTPESGLM
jgi:hypothetical protein